LLGNEGRDHLHVAHRILLSRLLNGSDAVLVEVLRQGAHEIAIELLACPLGHTAGIAGCARLELMFDRRWLGLAIHIPALEAFTNVTGS
jgi:hypothetical protein